MSLIPSSLSGATPLPPIWIPPFLNAPSLCLNDKKILPYQFSSDQLFCGTQESPATNPAFKPQSMGTLTLLWKAFKITMGMGVSSTGTAKERWQTYTEKHAIPEEVNIGSSFNDLRSRIMVLQQQEKILSPEAEKPLSELQLLKERLFAFMGSCSLGQEAGTQKWCEDASQALSSDTKILEKHFDQQTSASVLSVLDRSSLSKFKSLFEKETSISPELVLASNGHLLKNDLEVKPLSQMELVSQILPLLDQTTDPHLQSFKESLQFIKEIHEKVIAPFRSYDESMTKSIQLSDRKAHLERATHNFKGLLSTQLLNWKQSGSAKKKRLLVPGGVLGAKGLLPKALPYFAKLIKQKLQDNQVVISDFQKHLDTIESWIVARSQVAYYEIEADDKGTYSFRIHYGRPNAAHPKQADESGETEFQSTLSVSGVKEEALLSDTILRALLEPQLIGNLVRDVERHATDFGPTESFPEMDPVIGGDFWSLYNSTKNSANPTDTTEILFNAAIEVIYSSISNTKKILGYGGHVVGEAASVLAINIGAHAQTVGDTILANIVGVGRNANWDVKQLEDSLFSVLGGTMDPPAPTDYTKVETSSSSEWDAFATIVKNSFPTPEESEKFMNAIRLSLLYNFCQKTDPAVLGKDEAMLSIATAAQKSTARWALSLKNQESLTAEDLELVHLLTSRMAQLLSQAKEVEAARLKKESASVSLTAHQAQPYFGKIRLLESVIPKGNEFTIPNVTYSPIDEVVGWSPAETTWHQDLQDFGQVFLKHIDAGNTLAVIDGVELLVEQSEAWLPLVDRLSQEHIEKTITSISEIVQAYFVAHFDTRVPHHPDSRGFATIMLLVELADKLRQRLPAEFGLKTAILYDPFSYNDFLQSTSFRLYDPAWEKRLSRIREESLISTGLNDGILSLGSPLLNLKGRFSIVVGNNPFGTVGGERGLGLWRYRHYRGMWPLGLEALRLDQKLYTDDKSLKTLPVFQPLFNQNLPYWDAFSEKFPRIANGTNANAQAAAAFEDASESSLPKSFYDLRRLATTARYFLYSPFVAANGPVKNRNSYTHEFHAIHLPDISIPLPQFLADYFKKPRIEILKEQTHFFSEVDGLDSNFFEDHPEIQNGNHLFKHTHDPYKHEALQRFMSEARHRGINEAMTLCVKIGEKVVWTSKYNSHFEDICLPTPFQGLDWKNSVRLQAALSHSETQTMSLANFFSQNLHLFEGQDKKEWRAWLHQALFDKDYLSSTLSKPHQREPIIRALDRFCNKGYRYFQSLQKTDEAAYFLELGLMLTRYIDSTKEGFQDVEGLKMLDRSSLLEQIRNDIKPQGTLKDQHKAILAGVMARHLLDDYKLYTDHEVAEIVEAVMLYHRYPVQESSQFRLRRDAIIKGMRRIAPQVKRLMKDESQRPNILKKWVERIEPSSANTSLQPLDAEGLRYVSKKQDLMIDLIEGRLFKNHLSDQTLPTAVLNDPAYRTVFGTSEPLVELLTPTSWQFIDASGYSCKISQEKDGFHLFRELKPNQWYRYIPAHQFSETPVSPANQQIAALEGIETRTTGLGSLQFLQGYTHWHHEAAPSELLLIDSETQKPRYRVALSHSNAISMLGGKDLINAIHDLSHTPPLKLMNIYQEEGPYAWLSNMEDLRHVMMWSDSETGKIKRIELPRYRRFADRPETEGDPQQVDSTKEMLSFTVKDDKLYCDQIAEYYLESRQYSPRLPYLKSLFVLRNAAGDQKIILPRWDPLPQPGLAMRPRFLSPRTKGVAHHDYVVLERAKDKTSFTGVDLQANLYQAILLQTQHRYSEAAELLTRTGHSPKAYTASERKVLESMIRFAMERNMDEQPDAYIPAIHALLLLIKDHAAHGSDLKSIDSFVKPIFMLYYKQKGDTSFQGLGDENTAYIARYLLDRENQLENVKSQYVTLSQTDPVAAHRALAGYAYDTFSTADNIFDTVMAFAEEAKPTPIPSPYERLTAVSADDLVQLFNSTFSPKETQLTTKVMLQPEQKEFAVEFLGLIDKMKAGSSQERQEIANRCKMIQSKDQTVAALSQILIEFAEHPQLFSDAIASLNTKSPIATDDRRQLIETLVDTARQVASHDSKENRQKPDFTKPLFNFLKNFGKNPFEQPAFPLLPPSQNEGQTLTLPKIESFGPLIQDWKDLFVPSKTVHTDISTHPSVERYRKILAPFLADAGQNKRYKEESEQLLESVKAYLQRPRHKWAFKDAAARQQMIRQKDTIKNDIIRDEKDLFDKELEILTFLNRVSTDKASATKIGLAERGEKVKSRTLPELVLLFARGELNLIAEEKGLTRQELKKATRLIANYLTVSKHKDSLKYGLLPLIERLEAIKPAAYGTSQEEELLEEIGARLDAQPQADPEEEPALSGFEYFNRLLARGVQWEKIQELRDFFKQALEKKDPMALHLVQKIEMAFGKTFLMTPVYALIQAKPDNLVMGIFLKEQIQDVSKELGSTLGNLAQKIQLLDFDRNTEFTVKRLENILSTLAETKEKRHFLAMTPQSVRSFYLKFIETWDLYAAALEQNTVTDEYEKKISLMQQVLGIWEKADILMDEKDLIQNPKQRLSFAIGEQKSLPKERLGMIVEVYRVLTSESMQKKFNVALEFLRDTDQTK